MGVESIKVRGPDMQKMMDNAVAELKGEIAKVKVTVDEIKVDVNKEKPDG